MMEQEMCVEQECFDSWVSPVKFCLFKVLLLYGKMPITCANETRTEKKTFQASVFASKITNQRMSLLL